MNLVVPDTIPRMLKTFFRFLLWFLHKFPFFSIYRSVRLFWPYDAESDFGKVIKMPMVTSLALWLQTFLFSPFPRAACFKIYVCAVKRKLNVISGWKSLRLLDDTNWHMYCTIKFYSSLESWCRVVQLRKNRLFNQRMEENSCVTLILCTSVSQEFAACYARKSFYVRKIIQSRYLMVILTFWDYSKLLIA